MAEGFGWAAAKELNKLSCKNKDMYQIKGTLDSGHLIQILCRNPVSVGPISNLFGQNATGARPSKRWRCCTKQPSPNLSVPRLLVFWEVGNSFGESGNPLLCTQLLENIGKQPSISDWGLCPR